jgi:integrase
VYRAIPIPHELIAELERVHGIELARQQPERAKARLWTWCRTSAWNWIKACMELAGIVGPPASPKGLRHAFGVGALQAGVPINMVRHADDGMTAAPETLHLLGVWSFEQGHGLSDERRARSAGARPRMC